MTDASAEQDRAASGRTTDGEAGAHRPTTQEAALVRSLGRGPDARSTDRPSGLGTPEWLASTLRHCGRCGSLLEYGRVDGELRDRLSCPACGFITYVNPRLVVTTFPVTATGELVLLRRGIEPARGAWAQPGGFLEVDESVAEGAIRETLEEVGLVVRPGEVVGLYSRLEAGIVTIVFEAEIVGGEARRTPEALEVRAFPPDALPWDSLGFNTTYWALRDWLARRHPEVPVPEMRVPE
jgi:ADP-ribose pyrophosphatase YjhB (NUDIX family)